MTKRGLIVCLLVIISLSIAVVAYAYRSEAPAIPITIESLQATMPPRIAPTPRPTPVPEVVQSQVAPDGKHELFLEKTTLYFTKQNESKKNVLFVADKNQHFSIPFNTWSPDNKYVFLNESDFDYLVIPVSREPVTEPMRIVSLLTDSYPDFTIKNVPGWAGPSLLIVNSLDANGEIGPSFWFNPSTKKFTELSTRF